MQSVSRVLKSFIFLSFTLLLVTANNTNCESRHKGEGEVRSALRRPTIIIKKKGCPRTGCCAVQKQVIKSQGSATKELGRALRSALEKGNELQSAQLRTTRTEALAEPQDGFDAESALVAQGDADVHVFEKMVTAGDRELGRIKDADTSIEEDQAEFEKRRIESKLKEAENEQAALKSLELEELKLQEALDEEVLALEREISDTSVDEQREHARMAIKLSDAEGAEISAEEERRLAETTREADAKKSKSKEDLLANIGATVRHKGNIEKRELQRALNSARDVETVASDGNANIGEVESTIESRLESTASKMYGESDDFDEKGTEDAAAPESTRNGKEERGNPRGSSGLFILFKDNAYSEKAAPLAPKQHMADVPLEFDDMEEIPFPGFQIGKVKRTTEPSDAEPRAEGDVDDLQQLYWVCNLLRTDVAKHPDFTPEKHSASWWSTFLFGGQSDDV